MKPDGTDIEQLTHDERVNWFPHLSPDGEWIVYLSFPTSTVKHNSDKADIIAFNGGQGTFNINSWSSDSQSFAFVMYPLIEEAKSKP